jgi:hypothetical protein
MALPNAYDYKIDLVGWDHSSLRHAKGLACLGVVQVFISLSTCAIPLFLV